LENIGIKVDQSINETCDIFVRNYSLNGKSMGGFYLLYAPGRVYPSDPDGIETAGIIGMNAMAFVDSFCVDYKNKKLIINGDSSELDNSQEIPLLPIFENHEGIPRICIKIDGKSCKAVLDSGLEWILSSKEKCPLPVSRMEWKKTWTYDGIENVKTYFVQPDEVRIGTAILKNTEIVLWDEYAFSFFPSWKKELQRNDIMLGVNGFFDRVKVWISYKNGWVRIKPYDSASE
jgi:hypothetical protein